ncbi:MAG: 50S ribosome-binding GTPase [Nannocystaceae bacterium]|nr:50S ribosome-binding GTPase [Nannocystaceae bacterium]
MTGRTTLVGVATGRPDGGVAIVRLSGPAAIAIAATLGATVADDRRLVARRLALGGATRESALVVAMRGPASFTGEDVVELHVHGGACNVEQVVAACLRAGATAAGPGDFTRRAFEAGRLTLEQAEGIAALVGAQTQAALDQARRLVAGELGRQVEALVESIASLRTEVEAWLDFADEIGERDVSRWQAEIEGLRARVQSWLDRHGAGVRARSKPRVVLAGPANAGKSTLFNALLGYPRALVSAEPGTTRDYVEAELTLGDHRCTLVDTAGVRDDAGALEQEGIAFTREQLEGADVIVWLEAADSAVVGAPTAAVPVFTVESKRDLGCARPQWSGLRSDDDEALAQLRGMLQQRFDADVQEAWIGLERHRDRAREAAAELESAAARAEVAELAAFHLRAAQQRLDEILGRSTLGPVGEDVLERIFASFCIGK